MKRAAMLPLASALVLGALPARAAPKDSSRLALVMSTPFVSADVFYATRGSWASPGWAVPEMVHGAIYVSVMVANATDEVHAWHRAAWAWGLLGWGMLLHGTLSLVFYQLPGTEPARVAWSVGPDGISIAGTF